MASLDPLKIPHSPFPMFTGPLSRYFPVCLPLLSVINAVLTFRFEAATGGAAKDICFHDSGLDPDHLVDLTTRMRIDLIYTTDSSERKFSIFLFAIGGSGARNPDSRLPRIIFPISISRCLVAKINFHYCCYYSQVCIFPCLILTFI